MTSNNHYSKDTNRKNNMSEQSTDNKIQLMALSPEIIKSQATINIGTIGHVAHGKSTVIKSLSGVKTGTFASEKERNMTIKLGYANAKIFECDNEQCPRPDRYRSTGSNHRDVFSCDRPGCGGQFRLIRHVSFVDCPGHESYMAAMLNGTAVMDAAFLVIAADEPCPQPQTSEHLAAVDIMNLNSIIILQNKIDRVHKTKVKQHYNRIHDFIQDTSAKSSPIIPISAQLNLNMNFVCDFIVHNIPLPIRDFTSKPRMTIIRSFDINKPGVVDIDKLKGGVAGGSISKGILRINQEIEIRPGVIKKDDNGQIHCYPIKSKIVSLCADKNQLDFAVPGGLIGVGTNIDPTLCRSDRLVGHILGEINGLPKIYIEISVKYSLFQRSSDISNASSVIDSTNKKLTTNEILLITIGTLCTGGRIISCTDRHIKLHLTRPVCAEINEKIALSRRINGSCRLIGHGEIIKGKEIQPQTDL